MRVCPSPVRPAVVRTAAALAALVATACSDREPTAPPHIAPVAAVRFAVTYASTYSLGVDRDGVIWTLYPAARALRSSQGADITLSPELTRYFANIGAQAAQIAADDAVISRGASRRPPTCPPPKRVCPTAQVGLQFGGQVGEVTAMSVPVSDGVYEPPASVVVSPPAAGPVEELQVRVDMGYTPPGQTCRDIVAAWGRQQAGYNASYQAYLAATSALLTGVGQKLGDYRFKQKPIGWVTDKPGGFAPLPFNDAIELQDVLAEAKTPKGLLLALKERYGLEVVAVTHDVAAANYMSAMIQRGFYAQLYASYNCANRTDWQVSSGTGGGSPGTPAPAKRWRVCYYWVTTQEGRTVSKKLLYCQIETE